jgi:hypothetical protein
VPTVGASSSRRTSPRPDTDNDPGQRPAGAGLAVPCPPDPAALRRALQARCPIGWAAARTGDLAVMAVIAYVKSPACCPAARKELAA